MGGLTAWQVLYDLAHLSAQDTILIHSAAGAVGSFAVQLARWTGACVIATAFSNNVGFLKDLGANEIIDYKKSNFEDLVHNVDVVFDTVGGDTLERSWKGLRKGGRSVSVASEGLPMSYQEIQSYFDERGDSYDVTAGWIIVHPCREQLV
jgi:NADPH:quinone reductase-like Zn-dependent oxidoreductase